IAGVGPKIISFVDETISSMEEKQREELLENVQKGCVTVMVELNDETHEHIFPIDRSWVDHVAILNRQGFPWPQHDAYAFFDAYGLRRVKMEAYGMERLSGVMDEIRQSTDTEGAVLYLERSDGLAVGLVKVKSPAANRNLISGLGASSGRFRGEVFSGRKGRLGISKPWSSALKGG
ncbi:unnamed protein product, partial [Effrenium voratum]